MVSIRCAAAGVFAIICLASSASGQAGVTEAMTHAKSSVAPLSSPRVAPPGYNWDVREWSTYAGWGAAVGTVGGWAWGASTDRKPLRSVDVLFDALAGFCIGMVGGSAVYIIHIAREN